MSEHRFNFLFSVSCNLHMLQILVTIGDAKISVLFIFATPFGRVNPLKLLRTYFAGWKGRQMSWLVLVLSRVGPWMNTAFQITF